MATLQAALKSAIQEVYQLEDNELSAEPLPGEGDRRLLLLYEASEGGAGVLRHLVTDPEAFSIVARHALSRAHYDPATLEDLKRGPRSREDCDAACYDCLMSYFNQRDHALLDRKRLPGLLGPWLHAKANSFSDAASADHLLAGLMRLSESDLERRWLLDVDRLGLRLPDAAQEYVPSCEARPDFSYPHAWIFVDGPHHDDPGQRAADEAQQALLEDYRLVIRFRYDDDWVAIFRAHPGIFGPLDEERAGGTR